MSKKRGTRGRRFGSELGWAILEAVAQGIDIFEYAGSIPRKPLGQHPDIVKSYEIERERHRVYSAASRLKKQKILQSVQKNRKREFKLTRLGEELIKDYKDEQPPKLPQGKLTVVSYDIPEKNKHARQSFRNYLRSMGFIQLHRSVWTSDRDWHNGLKAKIHALDLNEWVAVFAGEM
ncbi:MAG: hypothetical protein ABII13_02875 [Patescibacteria group bacterium]|nr:hypothetical protein [Patescibacteria group bacterium]MBU2509272.1 hypothetical protein [Patescibacteria group bacterium]